MPLALWNAHSVPRAAFFKVVLLCSSWFLPSAQHVLSTFGLVAKSCLTLVTPWTLACQAPLSMGLSRQEYWRGLLFSSSGDLPDPGIKPRSPACTTGKFFTSWATREALSQDQLPTNGRSIITIEGHPKNSGYEPHVRLHRLGNLHKENDDIEQLNLKVQRAYFQESWRAIGNNVHY